MTINYKNAYKEVFTILNFLDKEDYEKIPSEILTVIKSNMNEEYEYEMNDEVDIFNQQMLPETKATLYNIFRDYLSTPEQKEKILKMQAEDRIKIELRKKQLYPSTNIFQNEKSQDSSIEMTALMERNKISFLQRIIAKIRYFFYK